MKILKKAGSMLLSIIVLTGIGRFSYGQGPVIKFGKVMNSQKILSVSKEKVQTLIWVNVNTAHDTWTLQKDILICSGHPIGVMRSEKQYENFILHIEWKHKNSGVATRSHIG
jgi:hypothetical protein